MSDLINRKDAIDVIMKYGKRIPTYAIVCKDALMQLTSAEPEPKEIGYDDCSSALLKMWMDGVLTEREYDRIMDKLNDYKWASGGVK